MLLLGTPGIVIAQNSTSLTQQIDGSQNPDELYQLGLAALAADQPDLARQALERVVVLRPGFAGAWLDLALATARSGDTAAAVEHLEYLRGQFILPPALAAQVNYWFNLWQTPQSAAASPAWRGEISIGLGYDSNANTGPSRQQIPLSLASGSSLFDVDQAFQPRADRFSVIGLTLAGPSRRLGPGSIGPVLLLRSKRLLQEKEFNTLDLQPGLQYISPQGSQGPGGADTPEGSWQVNLFAQHYRQGGQALYNGLRVGAQHSVPWRTCERSAGSEIETRFHQRTPSLGATLYSVNAGLSCPVLVSDRISIMSGIKSGTLSANLKAGFEQARFDRAGGNNRTVEFTMRYEQLLNATQSLQATWQIAQIADQTGYSPLLENNATRRLQRQTISLGMRQILSQSWEAYLNVDYFQQRANLPLFDQKGSQMVFRFVRGFEW